MTDLPTGTVTFFLTDVEGSTRLIQRLGEGHREVLERHARLLRRAVADAGGIEVGERGDGFLFVFARAPDAVRAAAAAQRALAGAPWPPEGAVRVRMGLHTGEGVLGGDNYMGLDVNRAARIAAAGHGGQVLLSEATAALVRGSLPQELALRDLGRHRLKDLPQPEPLFQLVLPGLPADFPPPRSLGSAPVRLPQQLTSFVGRERELRQVLQELAAFRLLTLTGPGGTGKTRLSLQAAAEAAPAFPDGVFFVPLDTLTDPALLAPTVLSSLELPQVSGDPVAALLEHLRPRRMLLVLDNFEQILAAGPQVVDWLREAPGLKVLVSSRAPLRVSGEREYPVPPLEVPVLSPGADPRELARSEAVALFVARAAAARPDFGLTEGNARTVAQIAARLDGLPLAIELAAARVRLFPPEAILARLSSRLTFLTGGARDLPARQQTLRGAVTWSYDLLEEPARRLFRRLSVFVGGAALPQVEAVCGPAKELGMEPLDGLAALVEHSLVRQTHSAGEPRFSMLETIRDAACDLLAASGEQELLQERHLAAYLALAEAAEPHLTRQGRCGWLDRLEEEVGNLRTALGRALAAAQPAAGAGPALRLVAALWRFWQMRGHIREGRERTAEALRLAGAAEGPLSTAETHARIRALWAAGGMAYWQADIDATKAAYAEALELSRRLADPRILAVSLYNAAFPVAFTNGLEQAQRLLDESLAIARRLGDRDLVGELLWGMGTIHWAAGRQQEGEPWYDEALKVLAGSGAVFTVAWAHRMRGISRLSRGDLEGARADLAESLAMFAADGDVSGVVLHLADFAALALAAGEPERAMRLAGTATALQAASGVGVLEYAGNQVSGLTEAAQKMGRQRAEALLEEGRAMPMRQAVAYALETPPL